MSSAPPEKAELKQKIRSLKSGVQSALEAKDGTKAKRLRRKVKLLKRQTRSLAKQAKAKPAAAAPAAEPQAS